MTDTAITIESLSCPSGSYMRGDMTCVSISGTLPIRNGGMGSQTTCEGLAMPMLFVGLGALFTMVACVLSILATSKARKAFNYARQQYDHAGKQLGEVHTDD